MVIRSRQNVHFKEWLALAHSARERRKLGLTVLDGLHLVSAYQQALGAPQQMAVAESAWSSSEVQALITRCPGVKVQLFDDALVAAISALDSPARVLAQVTTPIAGPVTANAQSVLVLENVQDPGNVGSMLRSAAAAGVTDVLMSDGCAFVWSPKVLRAAQGAHFQLNLVEGADVVAFVNNFRGQSLALAPDARRALYQADLRQATAWLVGNEGMGLSPALREAATDSVAIPMPGGTESLNVAASAAIALFEMVRQRQ